MEQLRESRVENQEGDELMKTKKKKVLIVIALIMAIIVFRFLVFNYFPIKMAKNVKLKDGGEAITLNYDMKQIYVYCDEDRGWIMIGHDEYKFSSGNRPEVSIRGKFPSKLNNNLYKKVKFVLNGYYIGDKNAITNNEANVFYVESYDLLSDFQRGDSNKISKYLTLSDLGANIFDFRIKYIGDSQN